ncbi:MAG: signal peptidase I [Verrucomicrobiota bacterium]
MKEKFFRFLNAQWREWRGFILLWAFVIIPVKSSLADWNWVPSGSMNPTILEGDLVYVNKLAYDLRFPLTRHSLNHLGDPERGDISVLLSPEDEKRLVKRVIGIPGDTVEMRDYMLYINDERLDYTELPEEERAGLMAELTRISAFAQEDLDGRPHAMMVTPAISMARSFPEITVPDGHYFVMGDNRDNSKDSRAFGFVERSRFLGEATSVVVSFDMLDKYQPRIGRFFTSLD